MYEIFTFESLIQLQITILIKQIFPFHFSQRSCDSVIFFACGECMHSRFIQQNGQLTKHRKRTHTHTKRLVLWRALNCVTSGNYILFYYRRRGCAFCSTLPFTFTAVHSFVCLHAATNAIGASLGFRIHSCEQKQLRKRSRFITYWWSGLRRGVLNPLKVFMRTCDMRENLLPLSTSCTNH